MAPKKEKRKYQSGSAKRKAAAEREAATLKKIAEAAGIPSGGGPLLDLPPAPTREEDGTAEAVTFSVKVLVRCIERISKAPVSKDEMARLKFIADTCTKIGIVRDKAAEQDRMKKLLDEKKRDAERLAGLTPVTTDAPAPLPAPKVRMDASPAEPEPMRK